ncbi:MAG: kynureninase [Bacteroidales bacterium]|nr:kynureninase [Bacteroidales bacterium]
MNDFTFEANAEFALQLDRLDELKMFRNQFFIQDSELIYLDGNSLGRLPLVTRQLLTGAVDNQWGKRLIRSWNEGWYDLPKVISGKIAKIIGADADEVMACDSTSMNLYKLAWAAIKGQKGRTKIVSDELNFPTDLYVLQSIIHQFGAEYELVLAPSDNGVGVSLEALSSVIDENTALVVLSHVAFKSAFMYDMQKVNELAHSHGALIIWDLSHAAGAVPLHLSASGADMAVGCTYKYLNGGPGSPAFLYVSRKLHNQLISPVWGWFGDERPFAFDHHYKPAAGIAKFMVGTPPILSLAAIEPGLDIILAAGLEKLREKSIKQTDYLIFLAKNFLIPLGFQFGSPLNHFERGSHVSLQHPEAYRICQAMINPTDGSHAIIPDFRSPDNIRFGITPIYTTYEEIYQAIRRLEEITSKKWFENYSKKILAVT